MSAATAVPPIKNIVLLLGDQHRQDCIGCYGNPVVRTPNIDALADSGVRFTHAFTPQAICTPARACIQTGLTARHHGLIFNWEFHKWRGGEWNLPHDMRLFPQDLAEAGLGLGHFGKWHIGDNNTPAYYGYEGPYFHGYGYPAGHQHYDEYLRGLGLDGFILHDEVRDPAGNYLYYATQEGPTEASIPAYLANQTIDFIRRQSDIGRPFFASCNFWGPHAPFRITDPHLHMYDDADGIEPWPNFHADMSQKPYMMQRQAEVFNTSWFTDDTLRDLIAKHYGYVTLIDDQVGRIIETLRQCGQLENTLIIYTADHGSAVGSYRMWDKGYGMYDCFWRIPMIFNHPSLAAGVNDRLVSLLDLAPTFCHAVGAPVRDGLDGTSLLPTLSDGTAPARGNNPGLADEYVVCEHYGHLIPFWQRMVRTHDKKYIYNPNDRDEFYDLAEDPWEMHNIIDTVDRATLQRMRDVLLDHIRATGDPLLGMARRSFKAG